MSILHLATNTVIQSRMTVVSGSKQAFATVTAALEVTIQPDDNNNGNAGIDTGVFGKQFKFYCDGGVDIQAGDRLVDSVTGDVYRVRSGGVVRRTYGSMDHLKVICERLEQ